MEEVTIPLFGQDNARIGLSTTDDQVFQNAIPITVSNPVTNSAQFYLEKRFGWTVVASASPTTGRFCYDVLYSNEIGGVVSVFGDQESAGNSTIYVANTARGTTNSTEQITRLSLIRLAGVEYVLCSTKGTSGFGPAGYYISQSFTGSSTFTGDVSSGSPVITNIGSTTNFVVGQRVSGTGIPSDTRILTIDSATQITMNKNGTSTNTGVTITREYLARILDTDFPTNTQGRFIELDGYVFIMTDDNRIYHSDLNSITSWNPANYITANKGVGDGRGVQRLGDKIVAFGRNYFEVFYNAGNPSGSVLSSTRITGAVGINSEDQLCKVKDQLFFYDDSSAYLMNRDFSYKKVSTNAVEKRIKLALSNGLTKARVTGFEYFSKTYFCISVYVGGDDSAPSLVEIYCPEMDVWFEATGDFFQNCYTFGSVIYSGSSSDTNGKIFSNSESSFQDNSSSFTMTVRTTKTDFGTDDLKSVWEVALMGSDVQSSGTATLEYSDDDYTTWVTAGTFDLTKINPRITRAGSFRGGRAWRITHSANTPFRAQALKFKFTREAH